MRSESSSPRDAVGEAGDVDDFLVGVQELRLAAGLSLASITSVVRPRWAVVRLAARPAGTGADDHDVPIRQVAEVDRVVQFGDFEVDHGCVPDREVLPSPYSKIPRLACADQVAQRQH